MLYRLTLARARVTYDTAALELDLSEEEAERLAAHSETEAGFLALHHSPRLDWRPSANAQAVYDVASLVPIAEKPGPA